MKVKYGDFKTLTGFLIKISFRALWVCIITSGCSGHYESESTFKIIRVESTGALESGVPDSLFRHYESFLNESYIRFKSNGTVSVLAENGAFSFGKYQSQHSQVIRFNLNGWGVFSFQVREGKDTNDNSEYLVLSGTAEKYPVKLLLKRDQYFDSGERDLLGLEENRWRFKPERKETDEEIKNRVLAQLDYMIAYFKLIDEKNYSSFRVDHLNSPFIFYSNAVGLRRDPDSPYREIYFDKDDSDKALKLLADGLDSISEYPSDPGSFTAGYTNVFEEIKRYITLL